MNTVDALVKDGLSASFLAKPPPEVWIAIRTDSVVDVDPANPIIVGDGTRENPWDGSTAIKLDAILSRLSIYENLTIHFGPGLFRTGGASPPRGYTKWQPFHGWKIIGAGQYQTTLLLTAYADPDPYPGGQNFYANVKRGHANVKRGHSATFNIWRTEPNP